MLSKSLSGAQHLHGIRESPVGMRIVIRAIHARAWQLNLFVGSIIADPLNARWSKTRNKALRDKLELTPGMPDFSKEAIEKIAVYQDVRYFAQSIREIVSTIYGAIGTCILPVLYALLGACAYLLRSLEEQFKLRTFTRSDLRIARFVIAAIGGAVVGLFNTVGDFFQRSGFLNGCREKGNDGTGAYDGYGKPDDTPKRPAETILLPH